MTASHVTTDHLSGAFCFYDGTHAYCASSTELLTDKGRTDEDAFNVSNIGSTTSRKSRDWFRKKMGKDPSFELLFVDEDIGDETPLEKLSGQYLWNEKGTLFETKG